MTTELRTFTELTATRVRPSMSSPGEEVDIYALPKVVLHDHLDGGLRPETVLELAQLNPVPIISSGGLRPSVSNLGEFLNWLEKVANTGSLVEYLQAFDLTTAVMQTEASLHRVAEEAVLDLVEDNVIAGELRWAPEQHLRGGLSLEASVEAVQAGIDSGVRSASRRGRKIHVRQILTAMRHSDESMEIAKLALQYREMGVAGFDIAGPEAGFPPSRFGDTFDLLAREMFPITIHAGEAAGVESIRSALVDGHAIRIGHGVRIIEDIQNLNGQNVALAELGRVASWVLTQGIPLEICPTSNLQTGALSMKDNAMAFHPFDALYKTGFTVTVNTDNRLVSNTTLSKEVKSLADTFRYGIADLLTFQLNAAKSLFLAREERQQVVDMLLQSYRPS